MPRPRTLVALGLALLAIVVAALAIIRPPQHRAAPPPPSTTTAVAPAPRPAPPPFRVVALTPFSTTVEWRTATPTSGRVSAALAGGPPSLWSPSVGPARVHRATIGGLALDSDYVLDAGDRSIAVHTPSATATLVAGTRDGAVVLDGQPFFPLLVWGECPSVYPDLLHAGIDLLAQNPCGGAAAQVEALDGRALSAGIAGDADAQNPSLIGWFYPDEADARRLTAGTLPPLPPAAESGRISFLTLSNHFYSQAAPLGWGRAMYPGLVAKADVVGFDLYPLQNWCQPDGFHHVYDAQAELEQLAAGKPTFQWIESSTMECGDRPGLAITPGTIRAESMLALAAGAHGLGFFPGSWTGANAAAVASVTRAVKSAAPALLAPTLPVEAQAPLRASARMLNDALYLVFANPTRAAVRATLRVPGAGARLFTPLQVPGEPLRAEDGTLHLLVPPLGGGIYVAAP